MTDKDILRISRLYAKEEARKTCGFQCKKCGITYNDCAHYDTLYSIKHRELSNRIDMKIYTFLLNPDSSSRTKKNTPQFVYFIKKTNTDDYKIGVTNNISKRMSAIKSSSGNSIEIICTIKSADAFMVEDSLHQKYEIYRKLGEWFVLDGETACKVIQDMKAISITEEMSK